MNSTSSEPFFRCAAVALVRAAREKALPLPTWPDLTGDGSGRASRQQEWLRKVSSLGGVSEAVEQASPLLAREVEMLCSTDAPDARRLRRTTESMIRYVQRTTGRATPYGLFAGVVPAVFGSSPAVLWRGRHQAVARADGAWISEVIAHLEEVPELLMRLPVMVNNTAFVRAGRLVVPYPPRARRTDPGSPAEVSLRYTSPVRIAVGAAQRPVLCSELVSLVQAEHPDAPQVQVRDLITTLVRRGVLISGLHAPSGVLDALDHLVKQARNAGADSVPEVAGVMGELRAICDDLAECSRKPSAEDRRRLEAGVRDRMTAVSDTVEQPIAVDLLLDGALILPPSVAREAERAATVLARLSAFPFGTSAWVDFHNRFFERYGVGSLVPLRDVVDPDIGLGMPTGYLDAVPEPREALTRREVRLLQLAQAAALDGHSEVVLNESLIDELAVSEPGQAQVPSHLELSFQVQAASMKDLSAGDFTLTQVSPTRGIGTSSGRFLGLLPQPYRDQAAAVLNALPVRTPGALPVQVSYSPLSRSDAHVSRAPELLPDVISLAEHRSPDEHTIDLDDLAVSCDSHRLYLVSLSRGRVLEPLALNALDLRAHTPPLARFLIEISRSQCAVLTPFPWAAAQTLPFLPRVRYGRTVLSSARWRLDRTELPGPAASWPAWRTALDAWCTRRRVPDRVALTEGDRLLPLDLGEKAHLALLRSHLQRSDTAVLTERGTGDGWFDGRAHEIVVPLTATSTGKQPPAPVVTQERVLARDHGHLPGGSPWLLVKLYGHVDRQPEILAGHLPDLLSRWDEPPVWWYMRYSDPQSHLRLRIATPTADDFAPAARRITAWAERLRRAGLVGDVEFATSHPETGRWGTGELMQRAEDVFAADSRALAVQFAQQHRPHAQVLAAANFVSLAAAFTGSTSAGMDWLINRGKVTDPVPLDRTVRGESVRLADPTDDWAAMRRAVGGTAIVDAWSDRDQALACYRTLLDREPAMDADLVLESLLHTHHIRATGLAKEDERVCQRLARAAALAWAARRG